MEALAGTKDPERQFALLVDHIGRLRENVYWRQSVVTVIVEHNLGFEAEHHERALRGLPGVRFFRDERRQRFGVLTTHEVKHAMCTLTNTMLREKRVHIMQGGELVCRERDSLRTRLLDQLQVYSYQFKTAADTFGKDRMSLSGKVGGMKDDLCICLQLGVYHTSLIQGWGRTE